LWGGREHRITVVSVSGGEPSTNLYLLRRPGSVSELSSFVSEVGNSSAEGENEVSRERFAIFHETSGEHYFGGDYPAISGFDVSKGQISSFAHGFSG
jgi:hypothetical protein